MRILNENLFFRGGLAVSPIFVDPIKSLLTGMNLFRFRVKSRHTFVHPFANFI